MGSVKTDKVLVSFSGGEFDPEIDSRIDLAKAGSACRTLKNFRTDTYGGAVKRPGLRFIGSLKGSAGSDTDFTPFDMGADNDVTEMGFFSDRSAVVVGAFSAINGDSQNKIAFINANGSLKPIVSPLLLNEGLNGIAMVDDDPDTGWFVVVGALTEMDGLPRVGAAAVNADGTHRTSFGNPAITFGGGFPRGVILTLAGKLLIYGGFADVGGVANTSRIALLNTDGTRDATFTGYANATIQDAVMQPDGMVLICGSFTTWKGVACPQIIRINPVNGDRDGTFTLGAGFTDIPTGLGLDSSGKVYAGIQSGTFDGHGGSKLHRLSSTGVWEAALGAVGNVAVNNSIDTITVDPAGHVFFGGSFGGPVDGETGGGLGAVDAAGDFISGWGGGSGVFGIDAAGGGNFVRRVHQRPGDVLFVVGRFITINGASRLRIAKLRLSTGDVFPIS